MRPCRPPTNLCACVCARDAVLAPTDGPGGEGLWAEPEDKAASTGAARQALPAHGTRTRCTPSRRSGSMPLCPRGPPPKESTGRHGSSWPGCGLQRDRRAGQKWTLPCEAASSDGI